jgi:hypothetical protein
VCKRGRAGLMLAGVQEDGVGPKAEGCQDSDPTFGVGSATVAGAFCVAVDSGARGSSFAAGGSLPRPNSWFHARARYQKPLNGARTVQL